MKKFFNKLWDHLRTNPKQIFFRVAFVLFIIWFLFDDFGIVKRIRMEAEQRILVERLKTVRKRVEENELRIQHAKDPDSVEKAAREKYNFRKEGETLFIIRDK
ncbi:MAG: septum formation initiator [Chlorobiaceae bacterium]|nr:septum formation initiator [Chlorobiaceae bacterium]NTV60207.1 septum formation initiator [Chlorobiaceae bacterium]